MTLRKRCKICGKLTGKIHNCPGFKETISCPNCGKKLLKTSLLKHLKRKCPAESEKNIICGCGDNVLRGHGHEARHLKSWKHTQWENQDRKLRKLGVYRDSSGRYLPADSDSLKIENPNYFRSISFGNHIKACHFLAKHNSSVCGDNIIFCYCGINCPEKDYGKHCISGYHKKWVDEANRFYDEKSKARKFEAEKKRKYRKRKKAINANNDINTQNNSGKIMNSDNSTKINIDPDWEFEHLNQSTNEDNDELKQSQKIAFQVLKNLKCTGNCIFYRGKEIEEILDKITKTK